MTCNRFLTMKKTWAFSGWLIGIGLFITASSPAQESQNNPSISGPVSQVITEYFALPGKFADWVSGPTKNIDVFPFQPSGNAGSVTESMPGVLYRKQTLVFDERGHLLEESERRGDDTLQSKKVFRYDEQGRCAETADFNADPTPIRKQTFTYDSQGRNTETVIWKADGQWEAKSVFTYDRNGKKTEWRQYTAKGPVQTATFAYFDTEHRMEVVQSKPDGTLELRQIYLFDSKGNITDHWIVNSAGFLSATWTLKYDERGHPTEETLLTPVKGLEFKQTFAYNERGDCIEKAKYGANEDRIEKVAYVYPYDHRGNWIAKMTYEWFAGSYRPFVRPLCAEYRKIFYREDKK